ncbi:MAG TPA: tRNA (guanosine(37)-N1)-methyltransferase TrmD [Candidatus Angelobacter sp.]|jgi:tRNA (guanine37-N1)-methyltransferase|nr:tRNA (guanosine(37)-N1)-methyltransferase TrmD [Candidatus Angelobacter sp.]
MKFEIVTIFPDFFRGPLDYGIVRRAREAGLIEISIHDLRDFTSDRHKTVDDRPFGGGEGMVLKPEPIFACVESLDVGPQEQRRAHESVETVVLLSPQGRMFNQRVAQELAKLERVVLLCGRYEGVDERVAENLADQEISIGDYILSGGEMAAAIMVDAITRLVPGALSNAASAQQESFTAGAAKGALDGCDLPDSTCASGGLLDYPHYTRPAEFRGNAVPDVLIGGNHEQIRKWRRKKALEKTLRNRPDLLEKQPLSAEDKKFLKEISNC